MIKVLFVGNTSVGLETELEGSDAEFFVRAHRVQKNMPEAFNADPDIEAEHRVTISAFSVQSGGSAEIRRYHVLRRRRGYVSALPGHDGTQTSSTRSESIEAGQAIRRGRGRLHHGRRIRHLLRPSRHRRLSPNSHRRDPSRDHASRRRRFPATTASKCPRDFTRTPSSTITPSCEASTGTDRTSCFSGTTNSGSKKTRRCSWNLMATPSSRYGNTGRAVPWHLPLIPVRTGAGTFTSGTATRLFGAARQSGCCDIQK
jgi:hypothetical protein